MQTAVLATIYLTAAGYVLVESGKTLTHTYYKSDKLSFAGAFLTILFWVCYKMYIDTYTKMNNGKLASVCTRMTFDPAIRATAIYS